MAKLNKIQKRNIIFIKETRKGWDERARFGWAPYNLY